MNDRELLELAAKAAGYVRTDDLIWPEALNVYDEDDLHAVWNPLTEDGDALRLAVKLRFVLFLELPDAVRIGPRMDSHDYWLEDGDDELSATRRAIVRAAAEIGKALP